MDDIPPDYETSVGGPPITGASDITVNESSVVLQDTAGRTIGLQPLYHDPETQDGESLTNTASSKCGGQNTYDPIFVLFLNLFTLSSLFFIFYLY